MKQIISICNLLYLTVLLMMPTICSAQQSLNVDGKILNKQSVPVQGVVVMCYGEKGELVSYSVTDEKGHYSLTLNQDTLYTIDVSHLSYERIYKEYNIREIQSGLDFSLIPSTTILSEVMIVAEYKKADTVDFDLETLHLQEHNTLEDILNKIPNFHLGEDNSIMYEGKHIKRILINEKEAFVNQNKTALTNIEAKMIDGVSVINDYNNAFELNFDELFEPVLNINTKENYKDVISGSIGALYGSNNQYDAKANLMRFTSGSNLISTHSTNTINDKSIDYNEATSLFRSQDNLSLYQGASLQSLFVEEENLEKTFFTNSTATYRNSSNKFKIDGVGYFISQNTGNRTITSLEDIQTRNLFSGTNVLNSDGNSILGHGSIAFKSSPTSIFSYHIYANSINNTNQLYTDQTLSNRLNKDVFETSAINGSRNINTNLIDQSLSYNNKISKKSILFAEVIRSSERSNIVSDNFSTLDSTQTFSLQNNFQYQRNFEKYSAGIKNKWSSKFKPIVSFGAEILQENIDTQNSNEVNLNRNIYTPFIDLEIKGNNIIKKLSYEGNIGIQNIQFRNNSNTVFIPADLELTYEYKLHSWKAEFKNESSFNPLEQNIETLQAQSIIFANTQIENKLITTKTLLTSYDYHNIFEGENFYTELSWSQTKGENRKYFIGHHNGLNEYGWFAANAAQNIKLKTFFSKLLLPLVYQTKLDLSYSASFGKMPTQVNNSEEFINRKNHQWRLNLKTMTNKAVNFGLNNRFVYIQDSYLDGKQVFSSSHHNATIQIDKPNWNSSIEFNYENIWINDTHRNRFNVNANFSYKIKSYTIELTARHLGEMLNLIDNSSYNVDYMFTDRLIATTQQTQSLRYILLGFTYDF